MALQIIALIRYIVFGVFVAAAVLAFVSWLMRTRKISPFSAVGRGVRQVTDPFLRLIERQVVRRGGNPAQAGWWLVIAVAILGVLVVSLAQWVAQSWDDLTSAARVGRRATLLLAVGVAYDVLFFAILVRVIASWLGAFRYSRWMRPVYWLTDWIIEPIRRLLPAMGPFDFSPLVALLLLWALKQFVYQVLL
jgi:YggT family protein